MITIFLNREYLITIIIESFIYKYETILSLKDAYSMGTLWGLYFDFSIKYY